MYAPGVDPKLGLTKLSKKEVARQLAAAQILKAQASGSQSQSSCSESDNPNGFDMRYSHSHQTFVKNAAKDLSDSDIGNSIISTPVSSPEPTRQPTPLTSLANSEDEEMSEDQRRQIEKAKRMSQKGNKKPVPEAKASKPTNGQERPGSKDPHPTGSRRQRASRAGGLRSGGGLGQMDTCVDLFNPSKT
jgi:hypothetical protein